jgi:hypothetical protein
MGDAAQLRLDRRGGQIELRRHSRAQAGPVAHTTQISAGADDFGDVVQLVDHPDYLSGMAGNGNGSL